jgi:hypothetical protein
VTWLPAELATWLPAELATWLPADLATWLPADLATWRPGLVNTRAKVIGRISASVLDKLLIKEKLIKQKTFYLLV